MRIAILSDIHDHLEELGRVLARVTDCEALLCLGDLCAPFTLKAIAEGFGGAVHVVWGNNDGDKLLLTQVASRVGNVTLHGDFSFLTLGERKIALTHYPVLARALAAGEQYDLVCYGHDHQRTVEWVGRSLLVNPGEVMGRFGMSSHAVYDTATGEAHLIECAIRHDVPRN
ncbi:MAG: metallophosphoesterase [Chloroflexi bacterium]|nr:metallophosphoesterase [Chloroflexota bacterium]